MLGYTVSFHVLSYLTWFFTLMISCPCPIPIRTRHSTEHNLNFTWIPGLNRFSEHILVNVLECFVKVWQFVNKREPATFREQRKQHNAMIRNTQHTCRLRYKAGMRRMVLVARLLCSKWVWGLILETWENKGSFCEEICVRFAYLNKLGARFSDKCARF